MSEDIRQKVRALYEDYQARFEAAERARKPGDGIFGLGIGPRDYPCHDWFAQALERQLREILETDPGPEPVRALLEDVYFDAPSRQNGQDAVYWMLLAVHGFTLDFVPLLDPADARSFFERYQAGYPRRSRLPVQQQVLAALKKRGA